MQRTANLSYSFLTLARLRERGERGLRARPTPYFEGGHEEIISLATVPRNVWNYWNRSLRCNDLNPSTLLKTGSAQRLNDLDVSVSAGTFGTVVERLEHFERVFPV